MNELYWIGRCAVVNEIAQIVMIAGFVTAAIHGVGIFISFLDYNFGFDDWGKIKSWFKKIAIVCTISALFYAFVPSKEEMYLILGVGGTIDYIQSSDKAGQLPDKCIDAIDAWVKSFNGEEEK